MYEGRNMMYPPYYQGPYGYHPQYAFHPGMYQMMEDKKLNFIYLELIKNLNLDRAQEVRSIRSIERGREVKANTRKVIIQKRTNHISQKRRSECENIV